VQTAVLVLTALVSVAASVLGLGLLVASAAPFDRAFADQRGAHLRMDFDGTAVTGRQLAATAGVPGVTAAAGPFPLATVPVAVRRDTDTSGPPPGADLGLLTIAGRGDPAAAVDALTLTAGRWADAPGELVQNAQDQRPEVIGSRLAASSPTGAVVLTVVGLAGSVTHSADGWATPQTVTALVGAGHPTGYQMLYRLANAATAHQISDGRAAISTALPAGAAADSQSYLAIRQLLTANAAAFVPFVTAFGVIALIMSVLVIGIVVGGTVGAATRRIGILKAVGFTPWQVARSYLAQALIPAAVGVLLGAGLAVIVARPVLGEIAETYAAADVGIPVWVIVTVVGAALALGSLSALLPALRIAGRRSAELLRSGRRISPSARGRSVQRRLAALPVPRAVGLGVGSPFRRPGRSLAMAATVLAAAVCLTFAAGLMYSLTSVQHSRDPLSGPAVEVGPRLEFGPPDPGGAPGGPVGPPAGAGLVDAAEVADAIASTPHTLAVFGVAQAEVSVSGLAGGSTVVGLSSDSSFADHQMVAGRWLSGSPGEAVLPTNALRQAGVTVGDRLTLSASGRSTALTVVGEVFDLSHDGLRVYVDASALDALGLDGEPQSFLVGVQPGTDLDGYLDDLNARVGNLGADAHTARDGASSVLTTMNAVVALLAAMVLVVAGIGVLNTVLLETRERARDIGVFKSLGMTPGPVVAMVLASVCGVGLLAGALGVPAGVLLHHAIVPMMGGTAGAVLTPGQVAVYSVPVVALLLAGGLVVAVLGALAPAGWAARSSSAAALRSE
jgi:putative ABC transport system permease protein